MPDLIDGRHGTGRLGATWHIEGRLMLKLMRVTVAIGEKVSTLLLAGGRMKQLLPIVLTGLIGVAAVSAQAEESLDSAVFLEPDVTDLSQFVWEKRPIVVFADSPNDPRFGLQMEYLTERAADLAERDVVVLTDTDPEAMGPLRKKLRPRGFMMVLIGKDGGVKLRKPMPWSVRELNRSIDKMPMREREIRERRAKGS